MWLGLQNIEWLETHGCFQFPPACSSLLFYLRLISINIAAAQKNQLRVLVERLHARVIKRLPVSGVKIY
jgi:hypothetical protein